MRRERHNCLCRKEGFEARLSIFWSFWTNKKSNRGTETVSFEIPSLTVRKFICDRIPPSPNLKIRRLPAWFFIRCFLIDVRTFFDENPNSEF